MAERHDLTTVALCRGQLGLDAGDNDADGWLYAAISYVSAAMEEACGRWLAPRAAHTWILDGRSADGSRCLRVPMGIDSLTYLGVAYTDQPDDGTGAYTAVSLSACHIRGRAGSGHPGTRVELDATAAYALPQWGYAVIKATGTGGFGSVPPRVEELATIAVVRSWRAKADGSGSPDIAVVGPEGGVRILRRIAPAEMAELVRDYGGGRLRSQSSTSVA